MKNGIVLALCLSFLPISGHAIDLLEVRLAPMIATADPDDFNSSDLGSAQNTALRMGNGLSGFGVDVLVNFPVIPLGIGARYEGLREEQSFNVLGVETAWDLETKRYAAIVNFRLIDMIAFFGPIATVGTHSGTLDYRVTPLVDVSQDLSADGLSFSLGVEGGIKLSKFSVGAEAGYLFMKFKDEESAATNFPEVDLSGVYAKLLLGYRFSLPGPL